jgi:hypothetical protein
VTKYAIAVENLEDYFERDSPGLVLLVIDACRTIAGFVVVDESNHNLVRKGAVDALNINKANSALFAFASESGKPALATSTSGQPSLFTHSLDSRMGKRGAEFLSMFKDVRADVSVATNDAQEPQVTVWSSSDLYLVPSEDVISNEKAIWLSALESNRPDAVKAFLLRYSTSEYAAAARKWMADNGAKPSPNAQFAVVSPVAVDRAWSLNIWPGRTTIASNAFEGFSFSRYLDSGATKRAETLDNRSLGLLWSGLDVQTQTASDNWSLTSIAAHGYAIATKNMLARVSPSATADVGAHVAVGTVVQIDGIQRGSAGNNWLAATLPGADTVYYMSAEFDKTPVKPLDLGKPLLEIQAPPRSDRFPDLIDPKVITDAIATLKAQGRSITWVSLATASVESVDGSANDRLALVRTGELSHAEYVLKHSGIDGKRITALTGVSDLHEAGVRVRFFGN